MLSSPEVAETGEGQAPVSPVRRSLRIDVEQLAWGGVLVAAALARLPALGALPLTLGDSSRAFSAWQVSQGRLPAVWDGDLAQTLTAGVFRLAGAGDGSARLIAALLGIALVGSVWYYRLLIGRTAALLAAFFLAISPVCVVISRSLSPYAAGALFAVATGAALLAFIDRPRPAALAWLGGLLGLGLSTDASFIVFVLAAAIFCTVEGAWRRRQDFVAAGSYLRGHPGLVRAAALIGVAGLLVAVTRFGIATDRLRSGALLSWSQAFSGVGLPWHEPLLALLAYEPLLLIGGVGTAVWLVFQTRKRCISSAERLLIYWAAAALAFALLAKAREPGQLLLLVTPLALLTATGAAHALSLARWDLLRAAVAPTLLAIPAFVYVLFVLESTTVSTVIAPAQQFSLLLLFAGGAGLLGLGALWSHEAAPAYLTACGLLFGTIFALHTTSRAGFTIGDEFLLGPTSTVEAPALGQTLAMNARGLRGVISVDPSVATPLDWYTRGNTLVRDQTPVPASAIIVQPVDRSQPPGFAPLVPKTAIAQYWYPSGFDPEGVLKWLLYRQAWQHAAATNVQVLVRSTQP